MNPDVTPADQTAVILLMDAINTEVDAIEYDAAISVAIVRQNLNAILVANKSSGFVLLFS